MSRPLNIGMPDMQDIGPTYTLRVTAISPVDGSVVSGVTVNTTVLDVSLVAGSADGLETGQWFLVPGPNA